MTDQNKSIKIGKYRNYMAEMKWRTPEKYDEIVELGGIVKYLESFKANRHKLGEMYYEVIEDKTMSFTEFWKLYMKEQYKTPQSFAVSLSRFAFNGYENVPPPRIWRILDHIVKSWEKYKTGEK